MRDDKKFVDISQINKVDLLYRLWNQGNLKKSKSSLERNTVEWDGSNAQKVIDGGYIDYYCGHPIWCDISKDIVNCKKYNSYYGDKMFQTIVLFMNRENFML